MDQHDCDKNVTLRVSMEASVLTGLGSHTDFPRKTDEPFRLPIVRQLKGDGHPLARCAAR